MNKATESVSHAHKEIKLNEKDIERFWNKVDKSGGPDACWLWTLGKVSGYGSFKVKRKYLLAHRVAWTLTNGKIPHDGSYHGICVLHRCDVRTCCNPNHLFLGTAADNNTDKKNKGRCNPHRGDSHHSRTHPHLLARGDRHGLRLHPEKVKRGDSHYSRIHPELCARGEANGGSKLTNEQVLEIRSTYEVGKTLYRDLSAKFGVTVPVICNIINRKTWKHI